MLFFQRQIKAARYFLAATCISLLAIMGTAWAAPAIVNIDVETKQNLVVVSANMIDALTENIIEAIEGGIPITFTYHIEMAEKNSYLPDKVISANTVNNTVHYDPLKKLYRFSSTGKGVEYKESTKERTRYQSLLVTLQDVPIASMQRLDPDLQYYVRVKADVETDRLWFPFNYIFFFVPFNDVKTSWAQTSPLAWKPEQEMATAASSQKTSKVKSGKPKALNHALRAFNQ